MQDEISQMAYLNKEIIRKNIFKLLDYSGLTDISFANLLGVSEKQIRLIKKGEAEFSIDDINKACDFFKKSLPSLNNKEIEIDRMFRGKLLAAHKGNAEYTTILDRRPSITYAINFELIENEKFRTKGLGVGEIKDLFATREWKFSSGYISTALSRNADRIDRISNLNREKWYLYTLKKKD